MVGNFSCPRCRIELLVREAPDMTIGECTRCAGIWLDNRACQDIVRGLASEHARHVILTIDREAKDTPGGGGSAYRAPQRDASTVLDCPICAAPLRALETLQDKHGARVLLDVCSPHGTWFDRHEAWTLLQAAELKQLSHVVEAQAAAAEENWKAHQSMWYDGAVARIWKLD